MAWILALIGNYYKQIQCISLSLQPTPALIAPDTAAAHHGNGELDQILTARAWPALVAGEGGNNGDDTRQQWRGRLLVCHSSGAMGNFDIWPTMEWRVGPWSIVSGLCCTGGGCEAI